MQYISHEIKISVFQPDEIPSEYISLIEEAKKQTQKSYAPYSEFHVGAAVLLENGIVVGGNNQENSAYPSGTCAERTVILYGTDKIYVFDSIKQLLPLSFGKDSLTL